MNTEENDDLWKLLGEARQPVPSPFFARNVLREIREQEPEGRGRWWSFLLRWQAVVASVCIAGVLAGGWVASNRRHAEEQRQLLAMAERLYASPDYGVISDLDELLDSEKNAAWLSGDLN